MPLIHLGTHPAASAKVHTKPLAGSPAGAAVIGAGQEEVVTHLPGGLALAAFLLIWPSSLGDIYNKSLQKKTLTISSLRPRNGQEPPGGLDKDFSAL